MAMHKIVNWVPIHSLSTSILNNVNKWPNFYKLLILRFFNINKLHASKRKTNNDGITFVIN